MKKKMEQLNEFKNIKYIQEISVNILKKKKT